MSNLPSEPEFEQAYNGIDLPRVLFWRPFCTKGSSF